MKKLLLAFLLIGLAQSAHAAEWRKHVITEQGHCNTAVALDANGDKALDVIASFNGRVSLFIAPDWKQEIILFRFPTGGACIHSAVLDESGRG